MVEAYWSTGVFRFNVMFLNDVAWFQQGVTRTHQNSKLLRSGSMYRTRQPVTVFRPPESTRYTPMTSADRCFGVEDDTMGRSLAASLLLVVVPLFLAMPLLLIAFLLLVAMPGASSFLSVWIFPIQVIPREVRRFGCFRWFQSQHAKPVHSCTSSCGSRHLGEGLLRHGRGLSHHLCSAHGALGRLGGGHDDASGAERHDAGGGGRALGRLLAQVAHLKLLKLDM